MSEKTLFLFAVLSLSLHAYADEGAQLFSAKDVFDLEFASDPRISPDGERIVYERQTNDIMTDSTVSNLWIVNVDGGRHRPLVSGTVSATSPRWSADGGRIAYIQATGNGTGIYVRWMDSGVTALLANLRKSPADLGWSPDGQKLAFVMSVPAQSEPIAKPREKPDGAEWSEPVKVIDTAQYRWDGRGFLETAYEHVFVIPADGGSPRQLTSGDFNHSGPLSWTPDGSSILFSANRDEGWELESGESDIYRISVGEGTLVQLTGRDGGEHAPTMSPDGRRIAYIYDDNRKIPYRNNILHIMAPDGSGDRALTADLDSSVRSIQWSSNRQIFFHYDQRALRHVARVSMSGDIADVAERLGSTSLGQPYLSGSFTVAENGTVAYTLGTAERPAEVAVAGRRGERVLTSLNDDLLGDRKLGATNEVIYNSSFDGQEIQGWFITPPDYDPGKKYPLILEIHGGPHLAYALTSPPKCS